MLFSEIRLENEDLDILKDVEFEYTGLVTRNYPDGDRVLSYTESIKYIDSLLENKNVVAVVCTKEVADELKKNNYAGGICVSETTRSTFFKMHNYIVEATAKRQKAVISGKTVIHPTASIGDNVVIGDNCNIGPNVEIDNCVIGNNVTIMNNCVIGSPAFYYFDDGDVSTLLKDAGSVIIKDDVVLHPSVLIQCGAFGKTVIGNNVKIDNKVHIGHDSIIKDGVKIAAGATLAGYSTIGINTFIGVGVVTVPLVSIGANALISAGSVVTKDVPSDMHYSGNFAIDHLAFVKNLKSICE